MPMLEMTKDGLEKPLVLMTRPDGLPAEVPATDVGMRLEKGYKKGYKEPENVTKRRAANKVDLAAENKKLKEQLEKLQKK